MRDHLNTSSSHHNIDSLVGGNILSLITYGMYTNPLAVYREYLQNAADSADSMVSPNSHASGKVDIEIDLGGRCVAIRDNGPGLSYAQARRELIPISKSSKRRQRDRGFRGIGRLSGLAFGDSVTFVTRCNEKSPVTQITWSGEQLRNGIDRGWSVEKTISHSVTIKKLDGNDYPANFFEARVEGISRYAASSILNKDAVREYLGDVCPVPFSVDFPYAADVSNLFNENHAPLMLDVYIDGEPTPVTRAHKNGICTSRDYLDTFREFEEIKIPALSGLKGTNHTAVGWLAHSSYLGALPKTPSVRGVRVRAGNIQVGHETVFDHLFSENRFNRWCVGEIHILDPRIVPNGRRDYFEPSIHLRNLENHLSAVCRKLERRCRIASLKRNKKRHYKLFLESLEATYDLVTSGYLTAHAAQQFIDGKLSEISDFREKYKDSDCAEDAHRLDKLENNLASFRFPRGQCSLAKIDSSEVSVYRKIFETLAVISSSPREAKKTIEAILGYEPN